eukprot:TRINITY_DN9916_c0_g1_i2.p2 TRINITY_DN9916_c0_g1~~TRINITY_DN9916_c0_g1_i2.p2  ORF type:complete len:113 (-),score=23.97 TRINITY_DN9916_c0_g1_i2:645-983(-)
MKEQCCCLSKGLARHYALTTLKQCLNCLKKQFLVKHGVAMLPLVEDLLRKTKSNVFDQSQVERLLDSSTNFGSSTLFIAVACTGLLFGDELKCVTRTPSHEEKKARMEVRLK